MNSRIRELADQCYYDDNVRPDGSRISEQEFMIFDKQKFAELIVRECAAVGFEAVANGDLVEDSILEHFGVEE